MKVTKPDFRKKKFPGTNLGQMGPKWPIFEVCVNFLEFESLNFSNFVEYNR